MYVIFIFNEIRYNSFNITVFRVTSAIFKFRKVICLLFANFAVAFIEKFQKIDQSYADLQASVFVLVVLSVISELNEILNETKHFSFDLNSLPPLQRAVKP